MFASPEFWVAVSFFVFLGIVAKVGGFRSIFTALDKRGERVRNELEEARRLREEATAVLAEYKKKAQDAERDAQAIVAAAREEAERVSKEAHARMLDFVARRTAAAESKIAQAEQSAAQAIRDAAADAAIKASEAVLRQEVKGPLGRDLLSKGLDEVKTKLHS